MPLSTLESFAAPSTFPMPSHIELIPIFKTSTDVFLRLTGRTTQTCAWHPVLTALFTAAPQTEPRPLFVFGVPEIFSSTPVTASCLPCATTLAYVASFGRSSPPFGVSLRSKDRKNPSLEQTYHLGGHSVYRLPYQNVQARPSPIIHPAFV